ncbi:hypothetical protein H4S04_001983 [Coemansia sp. S16]|nr:hypothetical protein H4S04_001983 [Coemansia sp. S16]
MAYWTVQDISNSDWIRWSDEGNELLVLSMAKLIKVCGSTAKKPESFMKNFSDYGFKLLSDGRCKEPQEDGRYWIRLKHEFFKKDQFDIINMVKRHSPKKRVSAVSSI